VRPSNALRAPNVRAFCTAAAACAVSVACSTVGPPMVVECSAPPTAGRAPGPALVGLPYGMQHSPIPLNSVQFASQGAASQVAIQGLYAARTPTDTVEVTLRMVSCIDTPQMVRVRTSFLRDNQAPAEAVSAWREVWVPARATATYAELSTSRNAAAYLIEIAAP